MHKPRENSRSVTRLFLRHMLDVLGINIAEPTLGDRPPATTDAEFTTRKIRYTLARGYRRITRETTCDRISLELAESLGQPGTTLMGVDGINGFQCGPTDDELRRFAHSLDEIWPQKMG